LIDVDVFQKKLKGAGKKMTERGVQKNLRRCEWE
jgi:hypothetical protein